ncbi:hypothetical protein JL720_15108 [Aureococcus anophagefferens]|nr:hypothetical protein JL720_15108 [Aureococcus anophagefferens]
MSDMVMRGKIVDSPEGPMYIDHSADYEAEEIVARWRKRLVWHENRPPEHYLTHLKQMEILAEEAHNRLVMIECFADHCAISHGFANVVADICDMFPKLVFMQINKMDRYNGHKMFECLKVGKFRDPRAAARGETRVDFCVERERRSLVERTELDASGTRRARPARRHTKYKTPTYMFFRNGEQIDEVVGANQPEIERIIKHIDWDPNAAEPDPTRRRRPWARRRRRRGRRPGASRARAQAARGSAWCWGSY